MITERDNAIVGHIDIAINWEFSREDIDDLLATAFEGGINYWCIRVEPVTYPEFPEGAKWASACPSRGTNIRLLVDDTDEDDNQVVVTIGLKEILNGIKQYCEEKHLNPYTLFDPFRGDYDANDADQIVQYACFQKVVFG